MSLFWIGRVLPVWVSGRAGTAPLTIAAVGALLLAWSQSTGAGWAITSVLAVVGAAATLGRARRRVDVILREELDAR